MSIKDELRLELNQTRDSYHWLLAEIPDEAFSLPSDNPAWTIGEVLFHMSLAPRFMTTDLKMIISRPWTAKVFATLVSQSVFDRLNDRYTRYGARHLSRSFLAEQYDRAHTRVMKSLENLQEEDFQKSVKYPGYDPILSGDVTVERLYRYIKLHFEMHAGQIRKKLGGILV
ncbi:MAG TPA: DinB family protein [Anaerolineales bacterium]|nr:DinB family protein [Anaerolineales bacterium]